LKSTEFIVRTARPDDYAAACALLLGLDQVHWENLPWLLRVPPVPPRSEESFAKLLEGPDSVLFVAESTELVGVAIGVMKSAPEFAVFIPQRWGVLDALMVAVPFRRHGVGARLTNAVEAWAVERGASFVELGVYDFNVEARRFYERLGYVSTLTKLRKPR
jgi:GNAT superfamily N-acetyltransferase